MARLNTFFTLGVARMTYLIVLDPQSVTSRCYASKGPVPHEAVAFVIEDGGDQGPQQGFRSIAA